MTIEIHKPELEAPIRQRMESGGCEDVEDVLIGALRSTTERPVLPMKLRRNLVDVLSEPPFAGSNLVIERQKDYPGPVDL
jgi:hypothetical protein